MAENREYQGPFHPYTLYVGPRPPCAPPGVKGFARRRGRAVRFTMSRNKQTLSQTYLSVKVNAWGSFDPHSIAFFVSAPRACRGLLR